MKYIPGGKNSQSGTKKSLGQHWLHDSSILEAIVQAGDIFNGDEVLEIGPGLGTLTDELIKSGANITALEFDQDLVTELQKKYNNCDKVAIIEGDIRSFDFTSMSSNYKIVANIPYYLTSNLIRSISETSNPPKIAVLLIQKEVAQRICALPGKMGILSVTAQFYFKCLLDIEVPARYFTPPPKVDSQVIKLILRSEKLFDVDEQMFFKFVKAGFLEKRKTLVNSFSSGLGVSKQQVISLLEKSNIASNVRAQELSMQQWHELYLNYDKK